MGLVNKLTPGSNLLWESSRIVLPEHRERIVGHRAEIRRGGRRERPVQDEQETELIAAAISESLQDRVSVRLQMYDPFEELIVEGIVERVDPIRRRFRVDGEWFNLDDVVDIG